MQSIEKSKKYKWLKVVCILFLTIFIIVGGFAFFDKYEIKNKAKYTAVCGDGDMVKANKIINYDQDLSTNENISKFAKEIKSRKGYDEDINCLNILFAVTLGPTKYIPKEEFGRLIDKYEELLKLSGFDSRIERIIPVKTLRSL